jgi:hypothetical protein
MYCDTIMLGQCRSSLMKTTSKISNNYLQLSFSAHPSQNLLSSYQRISVDLIWFSIPYKFKTFTLYLFFYFWGRRHELTIKVKMGIIKAYMISTLPNIGIFRFDHDRNKLLIFSIFFFSIKFFTFYVIMIKINPWRWYYFLFFSTNIFYLIFTVF